MSEEFKVSIKEGTYSEIIRELKEEVEVLRREVEDWRDCAQYDPLMEGPRFKGWNISRLDRCRRKYCDTTRS